MVKNWPSSLLKLTFICTAFVRSFRSIVFSILIAFVLSSCATSKPAAVREESFGARSIPTTYKVIPGDTLFSIAWRFGLKYEDIARLNHIPPPYLIKPSQIIRLDMGSARGSSHARTSVATAGRSTRAKASSPKVYRQVNKTPDQGVKQVNRSTANALIWGWPSKGAVLSRFQSNNGLNKGIDIGGILGEPVLAAASGLVVYSGSGLRGYGKLLIIKHSETFLSAYAHNDKLLVKEGDLVKAGQRIADMGSSGTDRVKLHFEIRRDGTPVDPMVFLPRR